VRVIKTISRLRPLIRAVAEKGMQSGLVPTMGALHEGHMSLITQCVRDTEFAMVSIFLNPLQFGPNEDLDAYPATLEQDLDACRRAGVHLVFAPTAAEMYPTQPSTAVANQKLAHDLCGRTRPGHFGGVLLVVGKLFHLLMPRVAYFGEKDFQQARLIQRMVTDLNLDVRLRVLPVVREPDGLALSSRNSYLNAAERALAPGLFKALNLGRRMIVQDKETNVSRVLAAMRGCIEETPGMVIDYLEIRGPDLAPIEHINGPVRLLGAVYVGNTRLIDNLEALP